MRSRFFWTCPPFSFRAEMKKIRDSFLIKNRENLTKFYQKFCFFQKFKFIHFTEALENFFNFLSMTIIVFDGLNNELRWNNLENYKIAINIRKYFPGFFTLPVFSSPLFFISTPVWHVQKNRDFTLPNTHLPLPLTHQKNVFVTSTIFKICC